LFLGNDNNNVIAQDSSSSSSDESDDDNVGTQPNNNSNYGRRVEGKKSEHSNCYSASVHLFSTLAISYAVAIGLRVLAIVAPNDKVRLKNSEFDSVKHYSFKE
jgi:hypothetical protein